MRQKCREFTAETHAEIIRAYKSKMSIDDLAKKYLVCRSTLYYWFRSIYRIKCRGRKLFSDSVEKDILKEYVSGKSYSDLMEKYNCSSNTIWSILRRQNCPVKGHVLFHNPRWNGGISYSEKGYKRLYMPGNPSSTKCGLIKDHRFIMERYIGRPLKDFEVVHHINGIKDDNRIENLKLMIDTQHNRLPKNKEVETC